MKMNNQPGSVKPLISLIGFVLFTFILVIPAKDVVMAQTVSTKIYTVKASSKPYKDKYETYSTYNTKTRQYYMLRSYLEQLEKDGGGSLVLTAGTYNITNSLYIPSHVTIHFEDGVIIRKTEQTGTSKMVSAKSLFQLAAPSKSGTAGAYGGYKGVTDIKLVGKGTAVIDMGFVKDSIAVVLGHNTNVLISGITFENMEGGHFIELDASQNVTIENNKFLHHKPSDTGIKEAINIDTPDKSTGGFHFIWTNYDCSPDKDILIRNNTFDDLERAIGTHKYSGGKYHENVQIINNKISNLDSDAIRILNWKNPVIKGNDIRKVSGKTGNNRAVLASGVINPTITGNTFSNAPRPIQIMPWKNSGGGSQYAITYNQVSSTNINLMLKNHLINVGETFIRVNKTYNVFDQNTVKYYYSGGYIS
ncbi:MAG TPA: right-handed parallel beta-helix repeat-containing protein [Mobilitalea sp.]|nr:right-handed parallel beta-helix repeat-containing protein [Mobilitalea sp.]